MNPNKLKQILDKASDDEELFELIVDAPFKEKMEAAFLFLGIIVLLLVDKKTGTINRVSLSNTELAENTKEVSVVPFRRIKIPLDDPENITAQAIKCGEFQDTTDWKYLFTPVLTPAQARINQASAGIAYSAVQPLNARDGGALIFSYFQYSDDIGKPQHDFMESYARLVNEKLKK